jgi:hypothetical protein
MNDLVRGWDAVTEAAKVDETGTGDVVVYTNGNDYADVSMKTLSPFKSSEFCRNWKIVKRSTWKLDPGDDVYYKMRTKGYTWNPDVIGDEAQSNKIREVIGGVTKVLIAKFHGALGKNVSDNDEIGYLETDLPYELISTARIWKLQETDRSYALALNLDDLTANELDGPTEHEEAGDNP